MKEPSAAENGNFGGPFAPDRQEDGRFRRVSNHQKLFAELLEERAALAGDICEFGVYEGACTRDLARLAPNRRIYAFDTYSGMPVKEFDAKLDHDEPGKFTPTATPGEMFAGFPNIVSVVGHFEDTMPAIPADVRFVLAYLDCDLYESYRQIYEWLPPRLLENAAIIIDDYVICRGCQVATDAFIKQYGLTFVDQKLIVWPKIDLCVECRHAFTDHSTGILDAEDSIYYFPCKIAGCHCCPDQLVKA